MLLLVAGWQWPGTANALLDVDPSVSHVTHGPVGGLPMAICGFWIFD
jgi:hypothetical protein